MANPVNPTDPMKFFAYELAATSKFKDEKWILTGSFNQEKIQDCVFDFIKRFVLCKSCRNPETVIRVDKKIIFIWIARLADGLRISHPMRSCAMLFSRLRSPGKRSRTRSLQRLRQRRKRRKRGKRRPKMRRRLRLLRRGPVRPRRKTRSLLRRKSASVLL